MKTVVSVSLGSTTRDHEAETEICGVPFHISRRGTNGQFKKAAQLLEELDGKVDAIGLGGIDIYLYSKNDRYALRDGLRLVEKIKQTPVVDGSGLKNTLERETVRHLIEDSEVPVQGQKVLVVSAMDRFGMAEALHDAGGNMVYGDLIFTLGVDKPIRTLEELAERARKLLPEVSKLPISMVYPIGKKQEKIEPDELTRPYYDEADIVAGDFHLIRKKMPDSLEGKTILTNTVTEKDIKELKKRGVRWLVTTTPEIAGRSYGTNVLEAAFIAILDKPWEEVQPGDYLELIEQAKLRPRITRLN